ncbi:hypothetical protein AURDEDRAFT_127550 [Auricularia subglabra TFB-10046 SS5]|nr:hypothetical protein AURDEDRAFT_127550 [Auricularia subglabra TFB-10046 SS5]
MGQERDATRDMSQPDKPRALRRVAANESSVRAFATYMGLHGRSRIALRKSVTSVLEDVTKSLVTAESFIEAFEDLLTIVHDARAKLAEAWNAARAKQLPPEILAACLRAVDFETRVRASHVSHQWRSVAVADGQLWASFRRRAYSQDTMDASLDQLSTMIRRSQPRPFQLHLPLGSVYPSVSAYKENIHSILADDFWRVQEYRGPAHIFFLLNPDSTPMPYLTSFRFFPENKTRAANRFVLPADWGSHVAPNLASLTVGILALPATCCPILTLRKLIFTVSDDNADHAALFRCFPNVVLYRSNFAVWELSLLTSEDGLVDIGAVLEPWRGQRIPSVHVYDVAITPQLLSVLLSFSSGDLQMRVTRSRIRLAPCGSPTDVWPYTVTLPESAGAAPWPSALRDNPALNRLVSLSVPIEHFAAFFTAQLTLPALIDLEFALNSVIDSRTLSADPGLVAPRLRALRLIVPSSTAALKNHRRSYHAALNELKNGLRSLITFDAELLETVTVCGAAEVMDKLACRGLERYAVNYTEIVKEDDS